MKNFILFLLVVIMFTPVDKLSELRLPTLIAATTTSQFDDEAIEGEFAMQVNNTNKADTNDNSKPDNSTPDKPHSPNCACKGTGKVKSGDGIVDVPCPCGNNCKCGDSEPDTRTTCQCGCGKTDCHCGKSAKGCATSTEPTNPNTAAVKNPVYYTYYISARWCGSCTSWKLIEKPKLEKIQPDGKPKWQFGKDEWKTGDNVVEVDADLRQDLVQLYEVPSYPAFVVVKDGVKLDMKTSYMTDVQFGNFHNDAINKDRGKK